MTPLTITSTLNEIWQSAKAELARALPADAYASWFENVECVGGDASKIELGTPSALAPYWICDNYSDVLSRCLKDAASTDIDFDIKFVARRAEPEAPQTRSRAEALDEARLSPRMAGQESASAAPAAAAINPRNTFENYIVGEANQLAHATALAVAQAPGKAFNPLFLYGDTGLGKTHLMHAIAHFIIKSDPSARVMFVSASTFVNDYVEAVRERTLAQFHRKYLESDVLLIDDIQFLSGKEASQKEFFYTFNELTNANKQIVISCDKPPSEVADIEARLVSRFEWGMCVDIKQPDYETRLAILRSKLSAMGDSVKIAPEVLDLIARRFSKNVRRMEGALNKIIGYSSLINSGEVVSLEKAGFLLADALAKEAAGAGVDVERIQRVVAEHYRMEVADICGKRRTASIVQARHVAMHFAKNLTQLTLQEIGRRFGGRDHGTVLHAMHAVSNLIERSPEFARKIEYLKKILSA